MQKCQECGGVDGHLPPCSEAMDREQAVAYLRRQLAAANERAGRLEKALIEWEGDWFTGGKTKIAADNRLRELLIEMRIIDRILGGA